MTFTYAPSFMDRVQAIIEENLANEFFSVEELGKLLFMSNAQVFRKIKKQTGCSPSIYIRNIRLDCAKQLIVDSDLRIAEIAYMVGFSYQTYFTRCFSERFGYPPTDLRLSLIHI